MNTARPISQVCLRSSVTHTTLPCRASHIASASIRPTTHDRQQRRPFFGSGSNPFGTTNPFSPNQTLTAQRTLRYPASVVYSIISDVASYSQFLPYCQGSEVTKYSNPALDGKKYPEEAKLIIGFNDQISEEFTSRVYCVPERVVEAVSGNMTSTLSGDEVAHHSPRPDVALDPARKDTVMAHLLTRWTLKPYPYKPPPTSAIHADGAHKNMEETNPVQGQQKTEVNLAIEFQFSNPLYAALSSAAAPKVAEKMIQAFEDRVKVVMDGPGHAAEEKKAKRV